jgi:hypothetical protein
MPTELMKRPDGNMDLIQTPHAEMAGPQADLMKFVRTKLASCISQRREQEFAIEDARKHKWNISPMQTVVRRTIKMIQYYEKVLAALSAGYVVMPPIDCEVFAVRINDAARLPNGGETSCLSNRIGSQVSEVETNSPPAGDGWYVSPEVIVGWHEEERTGSNQSPYKVRVEWPEEFDDEVPFPLMMAKPVVMSATQCAMERRIFDDIAISPSRTGMKRDPIILGRIRHPKSVRWNQRRLNFVIAWMVRTEEIG